MADASAPTDDCVIRPYTDDDRDEVLALWAAVFADDPKHNDSAAILAHKRAIQPELFFVALRAGRVVGTVVAGDDGVRGWVHRLAVAPEARREGIGARLMKEAELRLHERGCPKLNLQIRADNSAVQSFYESLGYVAEDRVDMGKRLD